jgi:hypothetical protein
LPEYLSAHDLIASCTDRDLADNTRNGESTIHETNMTCRQATHRRGTMNDAARSSSGKRRSPMSVSFTVFSTAQR